MEMDVGDGNENQNVVEIGIEEDGKCGIEYLNFDIDFYAKDYSGKIKIDRLLHIAKICPNLCERAYELALEEVKKGVNEQLYDNISTNAQLIFGAEKFQIDALWIGKQQQENEKKLRLLEDEIQRWRNLSNREKICIAYIEAAEFCERIGNYNGALSKYIEAKSYAIDMKTLLEIHLKIMITSIQSGTMNHVKSEASHALASEEVHNNSLLRSKLLICLGLYYLKQNRYESVVQYFIDCSFNIHNNFSEIISSKNIALYGGLCALASLKRDQLKKKILDNTEFKKFLELTPEIYLLIKSFYDSEYSIVMSSLNNIKKDLLLDLYLFNNVNSLLTAIRGKALVQYFSPYSAMDMKKMSLAFNVPIEEMEKELSICIADGHIQAKIDSHNKIVYASSLNKRKKLFLNVLETGEDYEKDIKSILLRMSLNKEHIIVSNQRHDIIFDMIDDNPDDFINKSGIMSALGGMSRKVLQMSGGGGGNNNNNNNNMGRSGNKKRNNNGGGGGGSSSSSSGGGNHRSN